MLARDHRFDGKFFVGVTTTGIYCRPICPARPKRENVVFFKNHLEAERQGYRPCLRCRPESAPRSPAWIGRSAVVRRAVKMLHQPGYFALNEDRFAAKFGVTARHLRRLFNDEIGKTPKRLSFENRLNLSRTLIVDTALPLTEIAFAAGFRSVRRFNGAFKDRFKKTPGEIRREPIRQGPGWTVSLSYRPPFDFRGLLASYRAHAVGRLEWFEDGRMHRAVEFGGELGTVSISDDAGKSRLLVDIAFPSVSAIPEILTRVRAMFDLDSDPLVIANALEGEKPLARLLLKHEGVRLPSGWDPFEIAIGAILGQLVSVERGRALTGDLIEMLGREVSVGGRTVKLFPAPAAIAGGALDGLKTTGMRKRSLSAFAGAVARGEISLEPAQDVEEFVDKVTSLPGIGAWTANYMALKALRHTDAFPSTDLILARALERHSAGSIERTRPWRGYVAALLWREHADQMTKKSQV